MVLYAYDRSMLRRLRRAPTFTPEFYGAEVLRLLFRTDPQIVADVLPPPLRPAPGALGLAFVARYPETNFGVSYSEGSLFLQATYRGEPGMYCLAMPVDDDTALICGRELYGFPKKIAEEITLDRDGGHVVGRVVRKGDEILRIEGELTDEVDTAPAIFGQAAIDPARQPSTKLVSYLFKFFPSPNANVLESPPRLVRQVTLFRPRPGQRTGVGKLELGSSPVDPLGDIPVRDVVAVSHGIFDNTMLPGRVLRRIYNPLQFAPYAMSRNDALAYIDPATMSQPRWSKRRRHRRELAQY